MTHEALIHPSPEHISYYPYDAIVVLPYTKVNRDKTKPIHPYRQSALTTKERMSHFTARAVLAGFELYQQNQAPLFVLPGEEKHPSTADYEKAYLESQGVDPDNIIVFPNLDGTQQQLDPIVALQKTGQLGKVLVVSFDFHKGRSQELMRRWGINGDIVDVETIHADFLKKQVAQYNKEHPNAYLQTTVDAEQLKNLPQLDPVKKAESGIPQIMMKIDKLFGQKAPFARTTKAVMGGTVTDIKNGQTHIGLKRVDSVRNILRKVAKSLHRTS